MVLAKSPLHHFLLIFLCLLAASWKNSFSYKQINPEKVFSDFFSNLFNVQNTLVIRWKLFWCAIHQLTQISVSTHPIRPVSIPLLVSFKINLSDAYKWQTSENFRFILACIISVFWCAAWLFERLINLMLLVFW